MSILLDGHTVTALEFHDVNGNTITKNLVESSSNIKMIEGDIINSGTLIYGNTSAIEIPNATELEGCTSFCGVIQLVETGTLATPGDPQSAVTLDPHPQSSDSTVLVMSHLLFSTGDFNDFDTTIQYPLTVSMPNATKCQISTINVTADKQYDVTAALDNNSNLIISTNGLTVGRREMYMKYHYKIYGV